MKTLPLLTGRSSKEELLRLVSTDERRENILTTNILVIDEVSMVSRRILTSNIFSESLEEMTIISEECKLF